MGSHLYQSVILLSVCVQFELGPHLYQSIIILSIWVWVFRVVPISIDHSCYFVSSIRVWDRTYVDRSFILSIRVWDGTYIDRSSSYQFEFGFLGLHLYRSVIFLSVCVLFELRPHLYWSVIHLVSWVESLGPHLYWSVIHLVSWVESCSTSSCTYLVESIRPWATPYTSFEFFFRVSITPYLTHLWTTHCITVQCYSLHIHSSHHPHLWLESHLPSMCPWSWAFRVMCLDQNLGSFLFFGTFHFIPFTFHISVIHSFHSWFLPKRGIFVDPHFDISIFGYFWTKRYFHITPGEYLIHEEWGTISKWVACWDAWQRTTNLPQ